MKGSFRPAVEIDNLSFGFGSKLLFDQFYFVPNSSVCLIEGYSGCGKTTLLKLISGVHAPHNATSVRVEGRCLLLLQEDALLPWRTGQANLEMMLDTWPRADGCVAELGDALAKFVAQPVYTMSYGQRRLIENYRALASGSEILLYDEPFNFLDEARALLVWRCLVEQSNKGRQIIVTCHHHRDFVIGTKAEIQTFEGSPPWHELKVSPNAAPNAQ
jgi:ABC-type nitrate/sulfonate/bicarbonate transport system ATPase subunit